MQERTNKYLDSLSQDGLLKKYKVTSDAGENVGMSAQDVLIHVFEEEVHHSGELIALLWQMNVGPPLMGWKNL